HGGRADPARSRSGTHAAAERAAPKDGGAVEGSAVAANASPPPRRGRRYGLRGTRRRCGVGKVRGRRFRGCSRLGARASRVGGGGQSRNSTRSCWLAPTHGGA